MTTPHTSKTVHCNMVAVLWQRLNTRMDLTGHSIVFRLLKWPIWAHSISTIILWLFLWNYIETEVLFCEYQKFWTLTDRTRYGVKEVRCDISLTPWSRILLEKLTGFAASQEIPRIYGTRKFITVLASARQLSLSWAVIVLQLHFVIVALNDYR
jgi:hypothetical protein